MSRLYTKQKGCVNFVIFVKKKFCKKFKFSNFYQQVLKFCLFINTIIIYYVTPRLPYDTEVMLSFIWDKNDVVTVLKGTVNRIRNE